MKTIYEINDEEYQESIIKEVKKGKDGYSITKKDGWSLWVDDVGIVPNVGDSIRIYGRGIGFTIRGVAINEKVVRYKTKEEEQLDYENEIKERIRKDKEKFEHNRELLDYKYNKLPTVFRNRIDIFRKNNPEFRVNLEAYEIFCNEQAVEIAKYLKTESKIIKFRELEFDEQKKLVPTLDDRHSGNTFGFSCLLAQIYLRDEKLVEKQHGALCVLVGCKDYGCQYGYK